MQTTNLHTAWARLFVRALARAGVRDLVVSPGSRSTPLALAASREPLLRCHLHVDERVASFVALGQARATGRPTALICTSGTAGAHWLPAAIEASLTGVPMVCVTADRPWEAYDCASPQTIDQRDLLGDHARHHAELGTPNPSPHALRAVGRIAAQCVHRARWPLPGAVHLNARFRKPLEPVRTDAPEAWEPLVDALLEAPPTRAYDAALTPSPEALADLTDALRTARRPWIVAGPTLTPDAAENARLRALVDALCARTGAAVLAETTSNVRFGLSSETVALPSFDALLRSPAFRAMAAPDVVIELGLPPTSPTYATVASELRAPRFVVAPHGWPDPHGSATGVVLGRPVDVLAALVTALDGRSPDDDTRAWGDSLKTSQQKALHAIGAVRDESVWSEGVVAHTLIATLADDDVLCMGNSLPVRDVDTFGDAARGAVRVFHQRGASGIDGLVAGAAGVRSVTDAKHLVAVHLGDISALHDLGGLNAARVVGGPLAIVVVQNEGGRIFEQLPLGRQAAPGTELGEHFAQLFTTPQAVRFDHAAAAFSLGYARVTSRDALVHALHEARTATAPVVIECVVEPTQGRDLRDRALAAVRSAL